MREAPPDGHFSPRVREAISKLEQAAPAAILARHGNVDYDRLEYELTVDPYIEDVLARVKEIASRNASRDASHVSHGASRDASHVASQMKNAPLYPLLEQVERWARAAPRGVQHEMCSILHGALTDWRPDIFYEQLRLAFDSQPPLDLLRSPDVESEPVWHYYLCRAEAEPSARSRHLWCARHCPAQPSRGLRESIHAHSRGHADECRYCTRLRDTIAGLGPTADAVARNRAAAAIELEEWRAAAAATEAATGPEPRAHRPAAGGSPTVYSNTSGMAVFGRTITFEIPARGDLYRQFPPVVLPGLAQTAVEPDGASGFQQEDTRMVLGSTIGRGFQVPRVHMNSFYGEAAVAPATAPTAAAAVAAGATAVPVPRWTARLGHALLAAAPLPIAVTVPDSADEPPIVRGFPNITYSVWPSPPAEPYRPSGSPRMDPATSADRRAQRAALRIRAPRKRR